MKCNIRELAQLSDRPCVIEGRLNYKKITNGSYRNPSVFKERWFRLINNYLFYFKISEMGKFDTKNPAGMFVLENSSIQMEHGQSIPFSFSISFIDEPEKRHIFAARAEDNVVQWVMKLRECSYEYLRSKLHALQSKIYSVTGKNLEMPEKSLSDNFISYKDPLLLVPRNEGACLWAPSVPFSTAPACTVNTSSFSCHLHTNGAFTLERSKSDVQADRLLRTEYTNKATFYTDDSSTSIDKRNKVCNEVYSLERSKTSALLPGSSNPIDGSIFDNRPPYSRAAPSPPVRTKLSPSSRRVEANREVRYFSEQGHHLGLTGILDEAPVKPRRKVSPKNLDVQKTDTEITSNNISAGHDEATDDLIKF